MAVTRTPLPFLWAGAAHDFALSHYVLNRARWNSRTVAYTLLTMILERFLPTGPVVIGIDDTIERRWGRKIAARGVYRDPVRSSHGHFVKTSGLRWLAAMAMVPVPWTRRRWALPFLTILALSERYNTAHGRRRDEIHVTDFGREEVAAGGAAEGDWLPGRSRLTKRAPAVTPGLRRSYATAGVIQPYDKPIWIVAVAQSESMATSTAAAAAIQERKGRGAARAGGPITITICASGFRARGDNRGA